MLNEDLTHNEGFAHPSSPLLTFKLAVNRVRYIQCDNHIHPPLRDLYTYKVGYVNP